MNPENWTLVHTIEYGIFTTILILIFYAYTSWLLKHNYKNSWENWFITGKNTKENLKWIVYVMPIIIISSYILGPFDFFGTLIVSCGVSTVIVVNVFKQEGRFHNKMSTFNVLTLWFALAVPFILLLWSSGYFFNILVSIIGDNL